VCVSERKRVKIKWRVNYRIEGKERKGVRGVRGAIEVRESGWRGRETLG